MFKNVFFILSLLLLSSCASQFYKTLPKEYASKERIEKAKGFAEQFLNKCYTKDYTEIHGYEIDASLKRKMFNPEKLKETCEKTIEKMGNITIGEFNNALTLTRPTDFTDLMVFKAKAEKNDSVKFIVVGLYRDKDFIYGIRLADRATPKIRIRIR